ncbi:hypothetical protein [Caenibacillus caldisaponilyticus]|uniref:hypothetical protein n=1 Tax=Caenibacillus caldisaponilyticus TaxID=1674942 RepID=UPI0013014F8F
MMKWQGQGIQHGIDDFSLSRQNHNAFGKPELAKAPVKCRATISFQIHRSSPRQKTAKALV